MPCYLAGLVTFLNLDPALARDAAKEIGLVEGRDYTVASNGIRLQDKANEGKLKQMYGVREAERKARMKGVKTQRKVLDNGTIQLTLGT